MVYIPSGNFLMGSPETEPERSKDEGPQHEVQIQQFFMSKYPITQAQWQVVAGLPQQKRELKRTPSQFEGEDRPVEQISWWEAVEFCDRLSTHTGLSYRLPSEAEWEYACRARATTPFHFGQTLTAEVANYDASEIYGKSGEKGEWRQETTSVGQFPANAFGLYDMHGNVWEWCADHWHNNYESAPIDGSAWLTNNKEAPRVRRGGSWVGYPGGCRSACRYYYSPDYRISYLGFRVVSSPQDSV